MNINDSKYTYAYTNILINKFGIKNADKLKIAEFRSVSRKIDFIATIQGDFDFEHLKNIHKFLFEDIYEWAGMERTIDLKKTQGLLGGRSVEYSTQENISKDINSALQKMKNVNWLELSNTQQATQLAKVTLDLWRVHPFRDGNTRTTMSFIKAFAMSKNIKINISKFEQDIRNALVLATAEPHCVSNRLPDFIKDYPQALLFAEFQNAVINSENIKNPSHISVNVDELKKLQENDIPFYFIGDDKGIIVKCDESQLEEVKYVIQEEKSISL